MNLWHRFLGWLRRDRLYERLARIDTVLATLVVRPQPKFPAIPVPVDRTDEVLARLAELEDRIAALPVPVCHATDCRATECRATACTFAPSEPQCRFEWPSLTELPSEENGVIPPNAALIRRMTRLGRR